MISIHTRSATGYRPRPRLPPGFLSASQQEATKEPDSHPMSGSRTSNLPGERLRPPRRVSTTLPGGTHSRQKSPCSLSSAPLSSERQQIHRCKCRRRKDSIAANRHRSGVLVVCRLQPPVSTRTYVQTPPPQRSRPAHRFWGYAIGTMGPPLMRTEHFRCGAAVAISAGSRRISGRVASFSRVPSLAVGLPAWRGDIASGH